MALLAKVYIIDIPFHADKEYSYAVPDSLSDSVRPGVTVEIPFGNGNRIVNGIVAGLEDGDIGPRTKYVISAIDDDPVLDEEMIGLCAFMKSYTLCTYGEALRAVVPTGAISKVATVYKCSESSEAVCSLGEREKEVYSFILASKEARKSDIQKNFTFDVTRPLSALIAAGAVRKETKIKRHAEEKTVRILSLPESLATGTDDGAHGFDEALSSLRGENQQKLLCGIRALGEASEREIYDFCGLSTAQGHSAYLSLEKKGFVKAYLREEIRNHFTPENVLGKDRFKEHKKCVLSPEQQAASDKIKEMCGSGNACAALLHGVTGSGKTNVIMDAIEYCLANGRSVIMLVPEIALTPQTVGSFMRRFGENIAVIHSALSQGERYDAWRRIRAGEVNLVIGTRSAIFAPLKNLGMIVIDEEQEYTYKSDTNPKYLAHDMARYRCREHNAVMLLASATPSITSYYKAKTGVYTLIELKERYGNATLPDVEIYDMREETAAGNVSPVGSLLARKLHEDKAAGNQAIVFLNRRGYNNYVSCAFCGKSLKCPNCSVTLTYHYGKGRASKKEDVNFEEDRRRNGYMVCHTCGYRTRLPETCPDCGKNHFMFVGCGTQKAEDDIVAALPDLRVLRMDYDTTKAKYSHEEILKKFRDGEADVLLGTQMVTKGHDFPRVATVGVLSADSAFSVDDYRAGERTFQMLTQVIGRAGRADVKGCAVIQTFDPANEIIRQAATQDYERFYNSEIKLRKATQFPPFCDIAVLTLSSEDEVLLGKATAETARAIAEKGKRDFSDIGIIVYGPFEAPVYKVQNMCRMRFVIKCRLNKRTRLFISELMTDFSGKYAENRRNKQKISVSVDLNPSTV